MTTQTKSKSGHGAGTRGGEMFKFDPNDYVIIGLDTEDGPEHPLYDERIKLPVPEGLVRNIQIFGVLKPVLFERDGDRVLVIDGRQRVRAARIARERQQAAGEEEIMVRGIPQRGDGGHLFGVSRAANIHQADSPLVSARNAQRMLDMGRSEEEVAIAFGVTSQTIKNWLALLELAPVVRKAVEQGSISPTAAARLRKLSKEEQAEKLAELTAEGAKPRVADADNKARAARGQEPLVTSRGKLHLISTELGKLALLEDDRAAAFAAREKADLVAVLVKIDELVAKASK